MSSFALYFSILALCFISPWNCGEQTNTIGKFRLILSSNPWIELIQKLVNSLISNVLHTQEPQSYFDVCVCVVYMVNITTEVLYARSQDSFVSVSVSRAYRFSYMQDATQISRRWGSILTLLMQERRALAIALLEHYQLLLLSGYI